MKKLILNILFLIITFLFILILSSCRCTKPLTQHLVSIDTIQGNNSDTVEIKKTYDYLRISRYGFFGKYVLTERFVNYKRTAFRIEKNSTNTGIRDGRQVHKVKFIVFQNGIKREKFVSHLKYQGTGGKSRYHIHLKYDENGKLIYKRNGSTIKRY